MKELSSCELQNVEGGFLAALGAFVTIFALPLFIKDHKDKYAEWGQELSQQYWDNQYPYNPNSNGCYGPNC